MDETTRPPHDHHRTCQHNVYYLTCEEFDLLWRHTGGHCWRCGIHESRTKANKLAIDHDQLASSEGVRGLLCYSCNQFVATMDRRGGHDETTLRYLAMMADVLPEVVERQAVGRARLEQAMEKWA